MLLQRKFRPVFLIAICALSTLSTLSFAEERGKALFNLCMSCHGQQGEGGSPAIGAPAIAGLPAWYIAAQLEKFSTNVRGMHPDDTAGHLMRPMARTLIYKDDIKTISAYVASLKAATPPATTGGNAERGKAYYPVCMSCHGPKGEGNEALKAPSLKISNDWYLVNQLMKFKHKQRASDPKKDPTGATMAPMAATLPDEQAMKDVIAYIQSLK